MTEDGFGILIFCVVAVVVLAAIVFFGIRSTRRKNRSAAAAFEVSSVLAGGQPVLMSSSMNRYDGKHQWELFQRDYGVGTTHQWSGPDGQVHELRVSRVRQETREGYPQAKVGFVAYFEPYEFVEFPMILPLSNRKAQVLELTREGCRLLASDGAVSWAGAWEAIYVAAQKDDTLLAGPNGSLRVRHDEVSDPVLVEATLVKYGTYGERLVV